MSGYEVPSIDNLSRDVITQALELYISWHTGLAGVATTHGRSEESAQHSVNANDAKRILNQLTKENNQ